MGKVFKRKLYDKMLNWKQTRDGSTALALSISMGVMGVGIFWISASPFSR